MILARVIIERIPPSRQKAAMPKATSDERVESQVPISCWLDLGDAYQLLLWLNKFRPILVDEDGKTILRYYLQQSEWPDGSEPPAPAPFDENAVAKFPRFDAMAEHRKMMKKDAAAKKSRKKRPRKKS